MTATTQDAVEGRLTTSIKRLYDTDDFNPFNAMGFIYKHLLAGGAGSNVAIVGYGPRFQNHIVNAWHHVLYDMKLASRKHPPLPVDNRFVTHTGATLHWIELHDQATSQQALQEIVNQHPIVCLCSRYRHPNLLSLIRFHTNTNSLYAMYDNNPPKDVDTEKKQA